MAFEARIERLAALLDKNICIDESKATDSPLVQDTWADPSDDWQYSAVKESTECTKPPSARAAREAEENKAKEHEQALRLQKAFDCLDFRPGEPVSEDTYFCPWKVIVKYPEFFIGKANKPRVKPYFDRLLSGKTWDFFYLHDPAEPLRRPYLLVPTVQFEAFLAFINSELGTLLQIPYGGNEHKFAIKFGQGGTPRPRYLCRSTNEKSLDIELWPDMSQVDIDGLKAATTFMQDDWREKMIIVKGASKNRPKKDKDGRKSLKQAQRKQMLLRAQTYLGLTGPPQPQDVVFVCVDVEAIERPPNPVSEIGFSILDTKNVWDIRPGSGGENWRTMIECHHLRVWEYSGLRNGRYVQGCPDAFDFGSSIFPKKSHVKEEILKILTPYTNESRPLVLVGHDIQSDLKWVAGFDVNLTVLNNVIGELDTKDMFQGWRDETVAPGLGRVLAHLGIPNKNLHNAGNDAYYTLCAMLGVSFEEVREREAKTKGDISI